MEKWIINLKFNYNLEIRYNVQGITFAQFTSKPATLKTKDLPWLDSSVKKIQKLFTGKKVNLNTIPIDKTAFTEFQKIVYQALQQVPMGEVKTYKELALMIGKTGASRAVGSAMRKNPIPIIIPCHRVIRSDGSLGNYSAIGGSKTKESLLRVEKAL